MGKRIGISSPEVISISPSPLIASIDIVSVGLLEQLYYYNDDSYVPDRTTTPLTLTPVVKIYDEDSQQTVTPTMSVVWTVFTPTSNSGTEVTTTSTSADFYKSGNNLIVRKNILYTTPYMIKCTVTYVYNGASATSGKVETSIILNSVMESDIVYPKLNIECPGIVSWNPLKEPLTVYELNASAYRGDNDVTSELYYVWYTRENQSAPWEAIDTTSNGVLKYPYYVSGQGTSSLEVVPSAGEDIQIMLKAKDDVNGSEYPDAVYRSIVWQYPEMSIDTYCLKGNVIKSKIENLEFDNVITIVPTDTLSDEKKNANFRFRWYARDTTKSDTYNIDFGFSPKLNITSKELWTTEQVNMNVFCEAYGLGQYEYVTFNGSVVTFNDNKVVLARKFDNT